LKKADRDSGNESKSSADSALTLAIGCAVAYLANTSWAVYQEMPAAEVVRDFTIGLATLHATDKNAICGFVIESQASKNRKTAIESTISDAANAGTTKEKTFYKTLATSLQNTRPGEDNKKDHIAEANDADELEDATDTEKTARYSTSNGT